MSGFGAVFADPARRGARGRVFDAEGWTPPWPFVLDLLTGTAVVKVAPGIPHAMLPDDIEAEWVSDGGEVKEAALWSPRLATTRRRATVIGTGGLATLTDEDDPYAGRPRPVREVGAFLYEPDGAVIRAGLVTAVAAGVGGGLLDEHIAYVTADDALPLPVRPLLPGPRGAPLPGEAAAGRAARARHRPPGDQEARRRRRPRAAPQAARAARRQRGDPRHDPGEGCRDGVAGRDL